MIDTTPQPVEKSPDIPTTGAELLPVMPPDAKEKEEFNPNRAQRRAMDKAWNKSRKPFFRQRMLNRLHLYCGSCGFAFLGRQERCQCKVK